MDLRVEYGHASSPRTPESGSGTYSDDEILFLQALRDGREGGDGACVGERIWHNGRWQESGQGVDDEDGGGPELKKEGFSSDQGTGPLMLSVQPVLDFDSNHHHSQTHHQQQKIGEMKRN